jgi:Helix-turn-helix domain
MVAEKGLPNHAQAALMLDVSTKRVGELVQQNKLTRFDFLGRTYVSMRAPVRVGRSLRIRMSELRRYMESELVAV